MIRFLYNLLWPLGLLFFLPGYVVKMFRRGNYRRKFGQRLGIYGRDLRNRLARQRSTWLHAVSVGEVGVALKLANELRRLQPDMFCVLTTTTTTGFSFAERNAPGWVEVMYNPLDFWPIMRRAFSVIDPRKIVLIEAEIWPNLVALAHARRIPIAVANARLSPHSEKRFRRFGAFVGPTFRVLDLVCVPEREDVERWAGLGVARERIRYTASIKYDVTGPDDSPQTRKTKIFHIDAADPNRFVLFGGSTHPGEEEILGQVFLTLRTQFPALSLFIAPRHVERAREIRKQLDLLSLHVLLTSEEKALPKAKPDCVLLDKTGELQSWYGLATVVFIGKSFGQQARGGQNPVEAIIAGVPVIFGPYMENFAVLAKSLVTRNGAIQVTNRDQFEQALNYLLDDKDARLRLVKNAKKVLAEHRGATARTAQLIDPLVTPLR
jgi:3-deoxy-D-manno-octulosonic-acid transferase